MTQDKKEPLMVDLNDVLHVLGLHKEIYKNRLNKATVHPMDFYSGIKNEASVGVVDHLEIVLKMKYKK